MKEKLKNIISKTTRLWSYFKKSAALSWRASPLIFSARIGFELIQVAVPIISLYLSKSIINILSSSDYENQKADFFQFVLILTIIQLFSSLLGRVNGYISNLHNDLVGQQIDLEIIEQINSLDISYFDNPTFYDQIQNAMRDSRSLQSLTWLSISIIKSIVQLVSNFVILIGLNVCFPFIIFALCIPGLLIDKYVAKRKYDWQLQRARSDRKLGYIKSILEAKPFAKDVRIFGVQEYFKKRFIEMWKIWYKEKKQLESQRLRLSFLASILPHLATTSVLVYVGFNVFSKVLTIGDYSLYGGIANQLRSSISSLTGVINQSYESELRLSKYADFLNLKSLIKDEGTKNVDSIESIEFKNVTFSYPQTDHVILNNVSFEIRKNRSLALVGMNGAGKSTIIKLLLRLYDPDKGEILVNSVNLKEYDIQSYYKCIGTVFQDFCCYNLSVRESVSLPDIDGVEDDERIFNACKNAGFDLKNLNPEKGLDTYLGKRFDPDGVVLSGGNWQKIAIAQAYFKHSSLMVFDEPNAALDPFAERRLFEKMEELSQDRCVVYVTHRLSSATTAGQIVVINNGSCVEMGTHAQLMELKGLYFDLFTKQAEQYRCDRGV